MNLIMMPNFIHTAMCGASIGLMDTGFSLFLAEKFKLDEFQIGLLFVPSSVSYMMVGFLVGYLTDKRFFHRYLCPPHHLHVFISQHIGRATMVIGGIVTIIVFYLIAPMTRDLNKRIDNHYMSNQNCIRCAHYELDLNR